MLDGVITLRGVADGFLLIPASAWTADSVVRQPGISRGVGLLTLEAALTRALQEGGGTRTALLDLAADLGGSPFFVTGSGLSDREVIATIARGVQSRRVLVMRVAHLPGAREIEGEPLAMLRALNIDTMQQQRRETGQNIVGLPMRERWLIVLEQVPNHLSLAGMGAEMKGRVRDFFSPESLGMLAATMAVMMMNPAGILALLAGGLVLGVTLLFAKDAVLEGIAKLAEVFERVESAKTKQELDAAAVMLAAAVTMIGVELFIKLIARAGPKRPRGGRMEVAESGGPRRDQSRPRERSHPKSADESTGRRGKNIAEHGAQLKVHPGQQGKHQPGHNNYIPGRSAMAPGINVQELVDQYALRGQPGNKIRPGEPGSREFFDTGNRVIGIWRDEKTGLSAPTTRGQIHYGSNGSVHVVPAPPRGRATGGTK